MRPRHLFAADIGGTRARLALASSEHPWPRIVAQHTYLNREYPALEAIIEDFLRRPEAAGQPIGAACLSVAAPVAGGSATLTNLSWRIDAAGLGSRFGIADVSLINDFAAAAIGISRLGDDDILTLQAGKAQPRGLRLVIGAGTGLGMSLLVWQGDRYVPHPSEGGHVDFAPLDEQQARLLAYLARDFGHVSCERVVSGPGLMRIFRFLQESGAGAPSRAFVEAARTRSDMSELIGEFALSRLDPLAVRALDLFVRAYGAFAGNMALATLCYGGLYVAGGIAPRIARRLEEGEFMRAFLDKGRFAELLSAIPVHVVLNSDVGLHGALLEAARRAGSAS